MSKIVTKRSKTVEFEGDVIQIQRLCLCVVRRGGKVGCLRWCAFVQSGTVSVQLHPSFGLVAFRSTSAIQWMGRQSLFLCLCQRSLLCFALKEPSSCSNHSPQLPRPAPPTPSSITLPLRSFPPLQAAHVWTNLLRHKPKFGGHRS